jgi:hypothetical protein
VCYLILQAKRQVRKWLRSDEQLNAAGSWIRRALHGAAEPHYKQKLLPLLAARTDIVHNTAGLESPELLPALLKTGAVKPGQYVEGTAFYSRSTVSHGPMTTGFRVQRIVENIMRSLTQGRLVPDVARYVLPTTTYPRVHKQYDVGFLYPHHMYGFAVPLVHDNTARSLPFRGRLVCVLNKSLSLANLDCSIVRYRGRVLTIQRHDLRGVYPNISDMECDALLAESGGCMLSIAEDDTTIEFQENSPVEDSAAPVIVGAHFVEAHWEQPSVLDDASNFRNVLEAALSAAVAARAEVGTIARAHDDTNHLNMWYSRTIEVIQPADLPYFHFQLTAPLNERPNRELARRAFNEIAGTLFSEINHQYSIENTCNDVNNIVNYVNLHYSILQSQAAKMLDDPVAVEVRNWLARSC